MDAEDEELLALLRAVVDGQAPPPVHTMLDDVVRRGRRRMHARRMGATLGVVAVVAGVGVASSVLRGSLPANTDHVSAASPASGSPTLTGWMIPPQASVRRPDSNNCSNGVNVPGEPTAHTVDLDKINKVLLETLHDVDPQAATKITRSTATVNPPGSDGILASTWADVLDSGGGGSVYIEVRGFSGTPTQAADSEQFVNGVCTPPQRKTLGDGTVMQLYGELKYDPGHPSQALRVYTPSHRQYVVTSEGFSSPDWTQVADAQPGTLAVPEGAGRHSLPLTSDQLVAIGEAVADID
ncbi:hypothetical protein [Kutzneria sp. NPDC052558]|uniref:hypothetical protein n=1 Tax=Kutzneria sp. NPDC052558 TaxID=3364121 RepID=UPI0037C996EB